MGGESEDLRVGDVHLLAKHRIDRLAPLLADVHRRVLGARAVIVVGFAHDARRLACGGRAVIHASREAQLRDLTAQLGAQVGAPLLEERGAVRLLLVRVRVACGGGGGTGGGSGGGIGGSRIGGGLLHIPQAQLVALLPCVSECLERRGALGRLSFRRLVGDLVDREDAHVELAGLLVAPA